MWQIKKWNWLSHRALALSFVSNFAHSNYFDHFSRLNAKNTIDQFDTRQLKKIFLYTENTHPIMMLTQIMPTQMMPNHVKKKEKRWGNIVVTIFLSCRFCGQWAARRVFTRAVHKTASAGTHSYQVKHVWFSDLIAYVSSCHILKPEG